MLGALFRWRVEQHYVLANPLAGAKVRYAIGLRASEPVGVTLESVETDARGDHWLRATGKGGKVARVARIRRSSFRA
ncbi:hypothetical protein [Paraburkholderia sp. CNPSo 3281]|uniref:hypothetical protein n=1 Tax=unclassified Paraburkholderia TaxID=2615204 RepID=UPI0035CCFCCC